MITSLRTLNEFKFQIVNFNELKIELITHLIQKRKKKLFFCIKRIIFCILCFVKQIYEKIFNF